MQKGIDIEFINLVTGETIQELAFLRDYDCPTHPPIPNVGHVVFFDDIGYLVESVKHDYWIDDGSYKGVMIRIGVRRK